MDMKYYIGILCAVTLVIGSLAGTYASAADDADVNEITKTISMEMVMEQMEAKGFEVSAEGNMVTAYKEGFGKTIQITMDCPGGECQFQKPQSPEDMNRVMNKTRFKFRMHGTLDMEAVKAKMLEKGYNMEGIEARMAGMEKTGCEECPMQGKAIAAKIQAAVEAGKITREQAKMAGMGQNGKCPLLEEASE